MTSYKDRLEELEDNQHLVSMVPVEELLRFGYEAGLNEKGTGNGSTSGTGYTSSSVAPTRARRCSAWRTFERRNI